MPQISGFDGKSLFQMIPQFLFYDMGSMIEFLKGWLEQRFEWLKSEFDNM